MAGVNIVLSANTEKWIADLNKAQRESNSKFNAMGKKAQEFGNITSDAFKSPSSAITGFLGRLGPVGMAVSGVSVGFVGMSTAALVAGNQVMATQKQLEALAKTSGMSVGEMNRQAIAAGAFGFEMDKLGDVLKDVNDRVGDYLSTGGGALQDYFDVIHGKINRTADDFRGLGSMQVLKMIQQDLDDVGASAAQQTFVLESLSSDASKLGPLLRMSEQDLDNMLKGYATNRSSLAQDTINDIQSTQNNLDMLQHNFNAALTNSFSGLIKLSSEMSKGISEVLHKFSEAMRSRNVVSSYVDDGVGVNAMNAKDIVSNADAIRKGIISKNAPDFNGQLKGLWDNGFDNYLEWFKSTGEKSAVEALAKFEEELLRAKDFQNAAELSSKGTGSIGNAKAPDTSSASASTQSLQSLNAQRTAIMREQGRLETELQKTQGEESRKVLEGQISNQEALLEANAASIKAVQEKIAGYNAEAHSKRQAALRSLTDTEEEIAQYGYTQQLEQLKAYLQEGSLTQDEFNQAKIIAEKALSDKLVEIKKQQLQKERELENKAFQEQQDILQGKLSFAVLAQDKADLELEIATNVANRQAELLNEQAGYEVVSEQQKQDKLSELRQQHRDQEIERELADVQDSQQRDILTWELKRQFLDEQNELGLLSEEAYTERSIEIERNATEAKRALMQAQLGNMSALFAGMAQNLEKGSKAQKAAFALEKAATIANVTLAGFDALAAIDKDPSLPTLASKNIAKAASVATTASQIGGALAVTLGQFHDGTDEVSSTGSYILKAGERVIQPEANRDLTNYLDNNKNNSGSISIEMPVTINGDVSEDTMPKLQAQLIENAELIAHLVNQEKANRGG